VAGVAVGRLRAQPTESELDRELKQAMAEALPAFRAVVEAQLETPSNDTRASSTMSNLRTLRSQLQLYKAQHDDEWPKDLAAQMIRFSDVGGRTAEAQSREFRFGPYLLRMPANPYTGVSSVTSVHDAAEGYRAAGDMSQGWWYNSATGEFRCHVPDSVVTPDGKQVNQL